VAVVVPLLRFGGVCFWRESRASSRAIGFMLVRLADSEDVLIFNLFYKLILLFFCFEWDL
jgi:hypothetical protein